MKLLEDHSLDIPAHLLRNEDGSLRHPDVVTAAVNAKLHTIVDPFEMTPAELGAQKDRQAIKEIKAAQARETHHKEKQKSVANQQKKEQERERKKETLQISRAEYFKSHRPAWSGGGTDENLLSGPNEGVS